MRILIFGDSITQGMWSVEGGWAELLRKHYDELAIKDLANNQQPEVFNLGISGDTTENLLKRIELETKVRKWPGDSQIAIVAIGINDSLVKAGKQLVEIEDFKSNLEKIINILEPLVEKILFVGIVAIDEKLVQPVSWDDKVFYYSDHIKKYEDVIKEVSTGKGITFVPIFESFQKEQSKHDLLSDGLHPNEDGHKFIYKLVLAELENILV